MSSCSATKPVCCTHFECYKQDHIGNPTSISSLSKQTETELHNSYSRCAAYFCKRIIRFFVYAVPKQFILHFGIAIVQHLLAFVYAFADIDFKNDKKDRKIRATVTFCKLVDCNSPVFISFTGLDYFENILPAYI